MKKEVGIYTVKISQPELLSITTIQQPLPTILQETLKKSVILSHLHQRARPALLNTGRVEILTPELRPVFDQRRVLQKRHVSRQQVKRQREDRRGPFLDQRFQGLLGGLGGGGSQPVVRV